MSPPARSKYVFGNTLPPQLPRLRLEELGHLPPWVPGEAIKPALYRVSRTLSTFRLIASSNAARAARSPLSAASVMHCGSCGLCILVFTTLPLFVDDDASHTFKLIKVLASRPPHSVIKQFRRQTMSNSGRRAYHPKTRISPNQLKTYHRPGPQFCS